jgi:hypothetical protein
MENGVLNGFDSLPAPEELEGARAQLGVEVQRHHVPTVACFTEERKGHEWAPEIPMSRGRASVDFFPFPFKETVKALESFPHVQRYVLPFPRSLSPERRHGHALRGQADCRHGAEADGLSGRASTYPTLWAITTPNRRPPWGQTV